MPRFIDLTGQRFGRLVVLERHGTNASKKITWLCRCDCGETTVAIGNNLKSGQKSCGCVRVENGTALNRTHGLSASSEYRIWWEMRARCTNPNLAAYPRYGGRGITVCERWASSFEAFYEDMGPRPSPEHSVDRINNDGPYSPKNCRWATPTEQANNKRNSVTITWRGRTMTMAQWACELGIPGQRIRDRRYRGIVDPEKLLFGTDHWNSKPTPT